MLVPKRISRVDNAIASHKPMPSPKLGTVNSGETATFDVLCKFQSCLPASGHGGETDRGQSCGHDEFLDVL